MFRLPDAAEFVVDILQRAAASVFAPDQVARSVVGVAAADRADLYVLFAALSESMGLLPFQTAYRIVFVYAADMSLGAAGFPMQRVAFDVADGFAIAADAVQVAAAVVQVVDDGAVGQLGTDAVAVAVVTVADFDFAAVVDDGLARYPTQCVVFQLDAAAAVAGLAQPSANGVVVVAAAAVGFGMPVAVGTAADFVGQPAEDVAFETVDLQRAGGVIAVFALFVQLSGLVVAVFGDSAVPAAFANQVVGGIVFQTVAFAVFVGEDGKAAGGIIAVAEAVPQRVGTFERQTVHRQFVDGAVAQRVGVAGQSVEVVVFVVFAAAVRIVGADMVARFVVVVADGLPQSVGHAFQVAEIGIAETGNAAGTVGIGRRQSGPVVTVADGLAQRVGNAFGFAVAPVTDAGDAAGRVGDFYRIAAAVVTAERRRPHPFDIRYRQVEFGMVFHFVAAAVRIVGTFQLPVAVVTVTGLPPQRIGLAGNPAVVVAFGIAAVAFGVYIVRQFVIAVETESLAPPQHVGNQRVVLTIIEGPFFAGIGGVAQYFAAGVVCVVTVAGNQTLRLAVFDHDVVAVGEAAQFFAAPAVYRGQIAAAVVVVTHHLPSGQRGAAEAVDVQVAVFAAEHSLFRRRIEIISGFVQPYRNEVQRHPPSGGVNHFLRQPVVAVDNPGVVAVAVEDGDERVERMPRHCGEIQFGRTVGGGYLIKAV